jgi:hypothetical protein
MDIAGSASIIYILADLLPQPVYNGTVVPFGDSFLMVGGYNGKAEVPDASPFYQRNLYYQRKFILLNIL